MFTRVNTSSITTQDPSGHRPTTLTGQQLAAPVTSSNLRQLIPFRVRQPQNPQFRCTTLQGSQIVNQGGVVLNNFNQLNRSMATSLALPQVQQYMPRTLTVPQQVVAKSPFAFGSTIASSSLNMVPTKVIQVRRQNHPLVGQKIQTVPFQGRNEALMGQAIRPMELTIQGKVPGVRYLPNGCLQIEGQARSLQGLN